MAKNSTKAKVSIIMGSDSDLSIMSESAKILEKFGIEYEMTIISAHRVPEKAVDFAKNAAGRGIKVIIAGAGGAAHLPGVVAALTTLPVIGVPVKSWALDGVDSLYSIVQMPGGIPVATVGINAALNAGLLAVRILSCSDEELEKKMVDYQNSLKDAVNKKASRLDALGYANYLAEK